MPSRLTSPGSPHALAALATLAALGFGCGGNGLGCGGGSSLPKDPAPWGFPMDQAIEGGMQARITKPGFDKISALVPALAKSVLPTKAMPQCMGVVQQSLTIAGTGGDVKICDGACGGGRGCPLWVDLRPDLVPPGGIGLSMADGSNPVVNVDAAFDVHMLAPLAHRFCIFGICQDWQNDCTLRVEGPGTHVKMAIAMGIDPPTGKLTISLANINLVGLNLMTSDCGLLSDIFNFALDIINSVARSFVGNTILNLLRPQITNLINGLLPNPPGMASRIDLSAALASLGVRPGAALELLAIAGGYVTAKGGGLNLGVITGANSDAKPRTRAQGVDPVNSEPALCVPARPTYDLERPPWRLALQAMRQVPMFDPGAEFAGSPDPIDAMGMTEDVGLGVSRTFLDLAGFHLFNSGALCLNIGDSVLGGQLNAGTLRILVPSLGNLLDNQKAPIALVLRPEQPLLFGIGAGGKADALLKISATDMRLDLYAFIEERYVRLFTLAADVNLGLDLAVTMDAMGKPAVAPMLSGISKSNVQLRVANADLLGEDPDKLAKTLGNLIDLAAGQLGGAIAPIALPSIMGFSLDGLVLRRVQTPEDDFVGIFGVLKQDPKAMPCPVPEGIVGIARLPDPVGTTAAIVEVATPPPAVIRGAAEEGRVGDGDTPSVTLRLGGSAPDLEWSYRVDGGWAHPWSSDARPTIADAAFLLQGHHVVEVRARRQGDFTTEDPTPERLEFVIDSVPPELTLAVDRVRQSIALSATDNVSEPAALRYAWKTPAGWTRPDRRDHIPFDEAWEASGHAQWKLVVAAYDEQGNHSETSLDLAEVSDFQGRLGQSDGSSGCALGAAHRRPPLSAVMLALLSLLPLAALFRTRRRQRNCVHD